MMLLAAAPVQIPSTSTPESTTALLALLGLMVVLQLLQQGATFVRWLGARAVASEDKEKQAMRDELRVITTRFDDLKSVMDQRLERQAEFYRAQAKEAAASFDKRQEDLEYRLRQDMMRAIGDASSFLKKQ